MSRGDILFYQISALVYVINDIDDYLEHSHLRDVLFVCSTCKDEYNLNPGLEWDDEFAGRTLHRLKFAEQAISAFAYFSFM